MSISRLLFMSVSLGLFAAPLAASAQAPKPAVSLRPFKPTALAVTRAAAAAQVGPRSKPLMEAWALYKIFQGSWQQGAPKPKAEYVAALDCLKAELEKDEFPPWFFELRAKAGKTLAITPVLDVKDPRFAEIRETEETERLKALGIVHLAEHELDRAGAGHEGAEIISSLMARTPLDFELHALYARFLLDAKRSHQALEEARYAIYLDPNPGRDALEFMAFVGLIAAKDGWVLIKAMLREAALDQGAAEAVIKEYTPRFEAK